MKVLVLVTRFPWPGTKGDQQRTWSWVSELASRHEVTVLTPARPDDAAWRERLEMHASVQVVGGSALMRGASALGAVVRGQPAQVGWMMPRRTWQAARRAAPAHDVVLAMTVRALRGPVDAPLVVDHVDALSLNMRRRATGPEAAPVRWFAAWESRRLERWEQRVSGWCQAQAVTAEEDAAHLPASPAIAVIPVGLDEPPFEEPAGHTRDLDVVFTGNMRYPPNRRAAQQFAAEIVPLIRRRREVRAVVVGRAADSLSLSGVEIASDVPSVAEFLRRTRVAVAPLEGGTGSPYKVLEAAAAGAALVTVPWAAERFGIAATTASTPEEYADAVVALLDDEDRRRNQVRAQRVALRAHTAPALARRVEQLLLSAAAPSPPAPRR